MFFVLSCGDQLELQVQRGPPEEEPEDHPHLCGGGQGTLRLLQLISGSGPGELCSVQDKELTLFIVDKSSVVDPECGSCAFLNPRYGMEKSRSWDPVSGINIPNKNVQ